MDKGRSIVEAMTSYDNAGFKAGYAGEPESNNPYAQGVMHHMWRADHAHGLAQRNHEVAEAAAKGAAEVAMRAASAAAQVTLAARQEAQDSAEGEPEQGLDMSNVNHVIANEWPEILFVNGKPFVTCEFKSSFSGSATGMDKMLLFVNQIDHQGHHVDEAEDDELDDPNLKEITLSIRIDLDNLLSSYFDRNRYLDGEDKSIVVLGEDEKENVELLKQSFRNILSRLDNVKFRKEGKRNE